MASQAVEIIQYRSLLRNLVAKDLKVRYKNSALGFVWSLTAILAILWTRRRAAGRPADPFGCSSRRAPWFYSRGGGRVSHDRAVSCSLVSSRGDPLVIHGRP